MKRHTRCRIPLLTLVAMALVVTPSVSFAQTPAVNAKAAPTTTAPPKGSAVAQKDVTPSPSNPMRVAFIDTTGEKGDDVYDELDKAIASDKRVQRINKEAIIETAKTYKLEKADFRDGNKRDKRKSDIDQFMSDLRAEALIIVDVFGRGRKAQLVVLDNAGKELSDQRTNIRKYKISPKTAQKMITKALTSAIPSVVEFRKKGGWAPDAPPVEQETTEPTPVVAAAAAPSEQESEKKKPSDGSPFHFSAGLYGTYTILDDLLFAKQNKDEQLAFKAKYPGFAASINTTYFFNDIIGLGLSLFGGYSTFTTVVEDITTKTQTKLTSYSAFAQAQLEVPIIVTPGIKVIPFAGGDFHRLSIKAKNGNSIPYTGNDAIGVRGGLQFDAMVSIVDINLSAAVLPSLRTVISPEKENSKKGLYGAPKKFVLGYEGRLTLAVRALSSLDVVAGYEFRYLPADLKEKTYLFLEPPSFRSMNHMVFLGLRYIL